MDKEGVKNALKDVHLMIATPAYGGQVTVQYLQSIIHFTRLAKEIDFNFTLFTTANESLVTRARNRCVAKFRELNATHLMFIDADIGFDPFHIFRFLLHDVDVVSGSYPKKGIEWGQLLNTKFKTIPDIQDASISHVVNQIGEVNTNNGLIPVGDAGTGFMLIKRGVVESMIEANPQWSYVSEDNENGDEWSAIFDCEIEDNRYLSEDYTFCRRWQRMGGTIWLDPEVTLTHTGTFTFGIIQ